MRARIAAGACAVALGIGLAACGGGGADTATPTDDAAIVETEGTETSAFAGGTVSPLVPAPALDLENFDGTLRRTADYRGKVVLVTFLYTQCPDICPVIVDNLVRVKARLGPDADRLAIVAVSVDPERDDARAVRRFLVGHRALGKADYLIGTRAELEAAWARWGIAARAAKDNPALVEHSGLIWGVDPEGRRATFYPATGYDIASIERDVRTLLGT